MEEGGIAHTTDLRRLVARFDRWRRSRKRGERIPASLWASATDLAREEGVSTVARALVLDYYRLKERVETSGSSSTIVENPSFVELAVDPALSTVGHEIEILRKDGAKLRIRSPAPHSFDFKDLVLAFLETSR